MPTSRRTITGQPAHGSGGDHSPATAQPGLGRYLYYPSINKALGGVIKDINNRALTERKDKWPVHDVNGNRKKCKHDGCKAAHLKGSVFCGEHEPYE